MLQFLAQIETLLLICWACTASLALLGWIILSAATGDVFPEGISKKLILKLLITSLAMVCMLLVW